MSSGNMTNSLCTIDETNVYEHKKFRKYSTEDAVPLWEEKEREEEEGEDREYLQDTLEHFIDTELVPSSRNGAIMKATTLDRSEHKVVLETIRLCKPALLNMITLGF